MLQAGGKILPKMTTTCGAKKRRDCSHDAFQPGRLNKRMAAMSTTNRAASVKGIVSAGSAAAATGGGGGGVWRILTPGRWRTVSQTASWSGVSDGSVHC